MIKMEPNWGGTIKDSIRDAKAAAAKFQDTAEFDFNGRIIRVAADSNESLLMRDFNRSWLYPAGAFVIGPYPDVMLSAETLAEDARLKAEAQRKQAEADAAYERKVEQARGVLNGMLSVAPAFAATDQPGWDNFKAINSKDGYSAATVRFAENWGRLMQLRKSQGETIAQCADECSKAVDAVEGITGFMYGCAVSSLAKFWIHGEELRRWHNKETQIGTEGDKANEDGGVLNPALLSIG